MGNGQNGCDLMTNLKFVNYNFTVTSYVCFCRNVLLVSLMNGRVSSLDLDKGVILWNVKTGSKLLSSSISSLEVSSYGCYLFVILELL